MRIKRIYIKDFGIFRDEKLEDLSKNIIVIGGYNRAGKTTFSRLFRHLPFGFNRRDKDIPEANVNYGISYDLENSEGQVFNIDIEGRKHPVVRGINTDKETSIEELYGDIDYFTYKQLFNISLDELQNTSIEGLEDTVNMQSVLLGAGYKQVMQIPGILKELEKESKKIGGKNGSPSTALFKPYNSEIKEGLRLRHNAKLQVDAYFEKRNQLKDVKEKILILKGGMQQIDRSKRELSLIKNNFNTYENLLNLDMELDNSDLMEDTEIKEKNKELTYSLLKSKDEVKAINENISGITEEIKNYNEVKGNCIRLKREISKKIVDINGKWKNDFNKILSINTDVLEFHRLSQVIEGHKELIYMKKDVENELISIKSNKEVMSRTAPKKDLMDINKLINRCFYIALAMIIIGVALAFVDYKIGIGLAIASGILGGACILISNSSRKAYLDNKDIYFKLEELTKLYHEKNKGLENINKNIKIKEEAIEIYKDSLDIEETISGDMLKDYFIQVKNIKGDINNLQELVEKVSAMEREIEKKLSDILALIERFHNIYDVFDIENIKGNLIEEASSIFMWFRKLTSYLDYVEDLIQLESQRDILKKTLINSFKLLDHNLEISKIKSLFEKYISCDEIEEEYKRLEKRAEGIEVELEKLIKMEQTLIIELENLYSNKDIDKAEMKIYNAKKELLPLAKKYAALKGAEFILKKLQENFIDKTKDSLLKEASQYLEEITKGEYISILPGEDLGSLDFKAMLRGGEVRESSNILSRATKEQLFLSVRLSRIKEITPSIPIVLDDSFVNFDESHTREVIRVLSYLSNTNQIFITTCHSRLVNYLGDLTENIKYLKLEKGKFSDCNKDELIAYLDAQ